MRSNQAGGREQLKSTLWLLHWEGVESSLGRTAQDGHLDSHSSWTMSYWLSILSHEKSKFIPPSPAPHTWVHISTFLSSWRKLQLTSMNPLWVFSRFSHSKHNEFCSRHHCINSVTVQLLWPVISLVYNLQGGKLSTAKKIQLLQAPVASFVCAELF